MQPLVIRNHIALAITILGAFAVLGVCSKGHKQEQKQVQKNNHRGNGKEHFKGNSRSRGKGNQKGFAMKHQQQQMPHRSKKFSQMQEETFQIPQLASNAPQQMPQMPHPISQVTQAMPQQLPPRPKKFAQVQQQTFQIPQLASDDPQQMPEMPNPISQVTQAMPQQLPPRSKKFSQLQEETFQIPQLASNDPRQMPQVTQAMPQQLPQVPQQMPKPTAEGGVVMQAGAPPSYKMAGASSFPGQSSMSVPPYAAANPMIGNSFAASQNNMQVPFTNNAMPAVAPVKLANPALIDASPALDPTLLNMQGNPTDPATLQDQSIKSLPMLQSDNSPDSFDSLENPMDGSAAMPDTTQLPVDQMSTTQSDASLIVPPPAESLDQVIETQA